MNYYKQYTIHFNCKHDGSCIPDSDIPFWSVKEGGNLGLKVLYIRENIAKACHVGLANHHVGITRTTAQVKKLYEWNGLMNTVKQIVRLLNYVNMLREHEMCLCVQYQ